MCGAAEYHNNHGKLNIMDVVFNQPEESPFFLAEPRTSMERLTAHTAHGRIQRRLQHRAARHQCARYARKPKAAPRTSTLYSCCWTRRGG